MSDVVYSGKILALPRLCFDPLFLSYTGVETNVNEEFYNE